MTQSDSTAHGGSVQSTTPPRCLLPITSLRLSTPAFGTVWGRATSVLRATGIGSTPGRERGVSRGAASLAHRRALRQCAGIKVTPPRSPIGAWLDEHAKKLPRAQDAPAVNSYSPRLKAQCTPARCLEC